MLDPVLPRRCAAAAAFLALAACSGGSDGSADAGGGAPEGPAITPGAYLPDADDVIVVEMESGGAPGSWTEETGLAGYTGASYVTWTGPNLYSSPGTDVFGFDLWIEEPGRYHFRIHNRHDHPDSTLANDLWARMDDGPWVKVFSWQRGQWTWATQHEFSHNDKPAAEYTLTAGNHRIEFSGRSSDFSVDRFHLYLDGAPNPQDTSRPESQQQPGGLVAPLPPMPTAALAPSPERTTLVELDARGAVGGVRWALAAGDLVDGTVATDPLARAALPGGAWVGVSRTIGAAAPEFALLGPRGPAAFTGDPAVGGRLVVTHGDASTVVRGPSGQLSRGSAFWPDEPGPWRVEGGATVHVLP